MTDAIYECAEWYQRSFAVLSVALEVCGLQCIFMDGAHEGVVFRRKWPKARRQACGTKVATSAHHNFLDFGLYDGVGLVDAGC